MYGSGSAAGSAGACTMKMLTARVCTASRSASLKLGSVSSCAWRRRGEGGGGRERGRKREREEEREGGREGTLTKALLQMP
jgi:hypothetical protein